MSFCVETVTAEAVRQAIMLKARVDAIGGVKVTVFRASPATLLALRLSVVNSDLRYAVTTGPNPDIAAAHASSVSLRDDLAKHQLFGVPLVSDDSLADGVVEMGTVLA